MKCLMISGTDFFMHPEARFFSARSKIMKTVRLCLWDQEKDDLTTTTLLRMFHIYVLNGICQCTPLNITSIREEVVANTPSP